MKQPTPTRGSGTAIWRQIESQLAARILSGELSGRLPNETMLAEQYSVNRHTIRQAIRALAERGTVEVVHGKGTFVREDLIDYQVGRRTRFAHSVAKARRVGKSVVQGSSEIVPRDEVLAMMALAPDTKVLKVDSVDVVDGKIIGVCSQYFPLPRFAGFETAYAETGKTHLALARFGVTRFQRKLSRITARMPSMAVAQQLSQPVTLPILYVETVYVDQDNQIIEYGVSRFSSLAVQLVIEPEQDGE
jgi:GntR family phosphonate transport system transcriptional regulator